MSQLKATKSKSDNDLRKLDKKLKKLELRKCSKTASTQTSCTVDIPYHVTDPLPPIFSSRLCRKTKPIHLSNSVPDLGQILWVTTTEDDILRDEAEQVLSDIYDSEISSFYEEARYQAAAARLSLESDNG